MSRYERELKGILEGDDDLLSKVTKSCDHKIKKSYLKIRKKPFFVVRSAGSFGIDLVAIRSDFSLPIEVKASKEHKIHFSDAPRLMQQARELSKTCKRVGVTPIYAYRLKGKRGDPWRMFTLPVKSPTRVAKLLPLVELTKEGNYLMQWSHGLPLHEFIAHISL